MAHLQDAQNARRHQGPPGAYADRTSRRDDGSEVLRRAACPHSQRDGFSEAWVLWNVDARRMDSVPSDPFIPPSQLPCPASGPLRRTTSGGSQERERISRTIMAEVRCRLLP